MESEETAKVEKRGITMEHVLCWFIRTAIVYTCIMFLMVWGWGLEPQSWAGVFFGYLVIGIIDRTIAVITWWKLDGKPKD